MAQEPRPTLLDLEAALAADADRTRRDEILATLVG